MEWEAPCAVLDARPYGEGDAVATVFSEHEGVYRGLARGGLSRARAATWQPGNLVQARWVARLTDQLGSLTAEAVHQPAALALDDPLALAVIASCCAVAAGGLPEREPHERVFGDLVRLLTRPDPAAAVRWEAVLLADLGYGLDLSSCSVTGATDGLAFVSPRTGRAVAADAAGPWRERLLPLPAFLRDPAAAASADRAAWRDGLRLTGHFLARDAFGHQHRPLPPARIALYDRVTALAETEHA